MEYKPENKKALYGVKQAPRAWNERIDGFLHQRGFCCSHTNPNLYVFRDTGLSTIIVLDGLIAIGDHVEHLAQAKVALCLEYEMIDTGLLHFFISLGIQKTSKGMFIS